MSTSKKVLIVEDEDVLADVHVDAFAREGIESDIARNGVDALKRLKGGEYGAVVLDIIMPKMNGFDVLRQMQTDAALKNIPVIVLTNLGQDTDRQLCKQLGACEYLLKTQTSQEELVAKIKKIVTT